MNKPLASFQSNDSLSVLRIIFSMLLFSVVLFTIITVFMESSLLEAFKVLLIVNVCGIPFFLSVMWLQYLSNRVCVYESGLGAPSDFTKFPVKRDFILWTDVQLVEAVKIGKVEYNNLTSSDNRELLVAVNLRNRKKFVQIVSKYYSLNPELKKMKS